MNGLIATHAVSTPINVTSKENNVKNSDQSTWYIFYLVKEKLELVLPHKVEDFLPG